MDQMLYKASKDVKDQESIQSSNTLKVSPFPAGDHKAARNRQDSIIKTDMKSNDEKDPQKSVKLVPEWSLSYMQLPAINQTLCFIIRHSCDNLQYIASEDTDFSTSNSFLTVAQCDVDYQNEATMDRCENQRQDLDTLLPVTEPLSSIHFR